MEVFPETINLAKKLGIKTVNYNPDNPFIFSGRGSGNKNITNSIALYDLHFTYDTTIKQRIEIEYSIPCKILPFGFDIDENLYKECLQEDEVIKVCFLGNPDKQRATFINSLLDKGVQIDLYGNSWNKFIHSTNATIFDAVYGKDFWKILRKYRVQLNIMRVHNPTSHNMRSFEIPSIGGVMLAPDTEDHRTYFTPNEEIFLYKSIDECVEKIRTILNTSVQDINIVRDKARAKSISLGYSYKDRAAYIVDVLKGMNKNLTPNK
ncbi:MAG: glycosyltransferase [Chitinophagales bacterium]|nr:glycosyltransferase [Chitinophagales bacterium]